MSWLELTSAIAVGYAAGKLLDYGSGLIITAISEYRAGRALGLKGARRGRR